MKIDWSTLAFQTVNVAVLVWLLGHFFWKPVAAMIAERKAATQKLTDEAKAAKTEADKALADVEKTRAGFADERKAIIAAAKKDADAAHTARLAEAETEAVALHSAANSAIDKAKKEQTDAWADRSSDLAISIAERLAARLEGPVVEACFLDWLVDEIGKLPKVSRDAATAEGITIEAITATKLDVAKRKHLVAAIGKALGGTPHVSFTTDRALIAGIELRGDHLIVKSSWRADLATIAANLKPDLTA
jgi:F-type H+-transporting ATPase subunit b